ncbi:alanine dehydrogenase [Sanguibacter antarcticus]|uniref:Alanine dehydrogenase n=1 Tax=Sanguibacter antarcticus TaxID=372484 RepID=A0A2A9E586_9MICO|nr:alanine dehydrogenase [Sanguibacter antarcticus]PFG33329.1 L-alanine dehydrogenase [Sanguibacter antarcticus]
MRIGVPTEVKNNEFRVSVTATGVHQLTAHGHEVLVQAGAGTGSAISDAQYEAAGAQIVESAADVWAGVDIVCKVKEPVASEFGFLRRGLTLFTYLHLAASLECTRALLDAGTTSIAYETVQLPDRSLPLLAPMSEVAGRLATQMGAHHLMRTGGGAGILMSGVPGVRPARVLVLGGGTAGRNAAQIAHGMRADVTVLDLSVPVLRELDREFGGQVRTVVSSPLAIENEVVAADLVIGAVLVPGAKAPRLVSNELVSRMRPGSVLVDVAVDQGGCFEDTHPTTHADPVYPVHGAVLYAVANMPAAVPVTSTQALSGATLPYLAALAGTPGRLDPLEQVLATLRSSAALAGGLMTHDGRLVSEEVAHAHGLPYEDVLGRPDDSSPV